MRLAGTRKGRGRGDELALERPLERPLERKYGLCMPVAAMRRR